MANKIVLKKSSVPSKIPTSADLDYGELAINYADGKLYFKTSNNTIDAFTAATSTPTTVEYTVVMSSTEPQQVDAFPIESYRSAEYTFTISSDIGFNSFKLNLLNRQIDIMQTQYADIGAYLGDISIDIVGSSAVIKFTPISANTEVKFVRTLITNSGNYASPLPQDLMAGYSIYDLQSGYGTIDLN